MPWPFRFYQSPLEFVVIQPKLTNMCLITHIIGLHWPFLQPLDFGALSPLSRHGGVDLGSNNINYGRLCT